MSSIRTHQVSWLSYPLFKCVLIAFLSLALALSSFILRNPESAFAQPYAFSCRIAATIIFHIPWGSSVSAYSDVTNCTARASTIETTVDLLEFNSSTGKWTAITDNYNSCSGCYALSTSLITTPSLGREYKGEAWFVAYSGGLQSTGTSFTRCWLILSDGPYGCDDKSV